MTQERPHEPASLPETAGTEPGAPASTPHPPQALTSLRKAMRRARHDDAERVGAISDLRAARIGRLELLEDALEPLQAEIPEDVDIFDFGLMPGANPRLFIDMIGFVEMGRDARGYRLVQDTRYGRKLIAESDGVPRMVEAVTDYVARRLLERDKALASDGDVAEPFVMPSRDQSSRQQEPRRQANLPRRRRGFGIAGAVFAFVIDLLGVIAFFSILFAILFYVALQIWPNLTELWQPPSAPR